MDSILVLYCLLLWLGFCTAVATAANTRNRFAFGWFLAAFFLTPLLAACFLFAVPAKPTAAELTELRHRPQH